MSRRMPLTTMHSVQACAALGMDYWADHPSPMTVWALDGSGTPSRVRINRTDLTALHCDTGRMASYTVPSDMYGLSIASTIEQEDTPVLTAPPSAGKTPARKTPDRKTPARTPLKSVPAKKAPAKPVRGKAPIRKPATPAAKVPPARVPAPVPLRRMTMRAVLKLIHHDPDYLEDIDNTRLVDALGRTPYDSKIRAELKARGLTPSDSVVRLKSRRGKAS